MEPRNRQGRRSGGGRATRAPTARASGASGASARSTPAPAGGVHAMRMPPEPEPRDRGTTNGDDGASRPTGEMPGRGGTAAEPLPRFGGRLAGLGALGAPPAGEMPGGDMNGGLDAPLAPGDAQGAAGVAGADALDAPPADARDMPTGTMDDAGREGTAGAMHATMNEGRAGMPTGAMTGGDGAMPNAGALRRREDPDAGGEVRRQMPADDGGELGAAPSDGAGAMPSADMHRSPATAPDASAEAGAAFPLVLGGEWRLTLSSISLGRGS